MQIEMWEESEWWMDSKICHSEKKTSKVDEKLIFPLCGINEISSYYQIIRFVSPACFDRELHYSRSTDDREDAFTRLTFYEADSGL